MAWHSNLPNFGWPASGGLLTYAADGQPVVIYTSRPLAAIVARRSPSVMADSVAAPLDPAEIPVSGDTIVEPNCDRDDDNGRKRGRPAGDAHALPNSADTDDSTASTDAPPRRKRGRPASKLRSVSSNDGDSSAHPAHAMGRQATPASAAVVPAPVKLNNRGRPVRVTASTGVGSKTAAASAALLAEERARESRPHDRRKGSAAAAAASATSASASSAASKDKWVQYHTRVSNLLSVVRFQSAFIDAYEGEGHRGGNAEKAKPVGELLKARRALMVAKGKLRSLLIAVDAESDAHTRWNVWGTAKPSASTSRAATASVEPQLKIAAAAAAEMLRKRKEGTLAAEAAAAPSDFSGSDSEDGGDLGSDSDGAYGGGGRSIMKSVKRRGPAPAARATGNGRFTGGAAAASTAAPPASLLAPAALPVSATTTSATAAATTLYPSPAASPLYVNSAAVSALQARSSSPSAATAAAAAAAAVRSAAPAPAAAPAAAKALFASSSPAALACFAALCAAPPAAVPLVGVAAGYALKHYGTAAPSALRALPPQLVLVPTQPPPLSNSGSSTGSSSNSSGGGGSGFTALSVPIDIYLAYMALGEVMWAGPGQLPRLSPADFIDPSPHGPSEQPLKLLDLTEPAGAARRAGSGSSADAGGSDGAGAGIPQMGAESSAASPSSYSSASSSTVGGGIGADVGPSLLILIDAEVEGHLLRQRERFGLLQNPKLSASSPHSSIFNGAAAEEDIKATSARSPPSSFSSCLLQSPPTASNEETSSLSLRTLLSSPTRAVSGSPRKGVNNSRVNSNSGSVGFSEGASSAHSATASVASAAPSSAAAAAALVVVDDDDDGIDAEEIGCSKCGSFEADDDNDILLCEWGNLHLDGVSFVGVVLFVLLLLPRTLAALLQNMQK